MINFCKPNNPFINIYNPIRCVRAPCPAEYEAHLIVRNKEKPITCKIPACEGVYKTGEYDKNGCPIYKCPEQIEVKEQVKCVFQGSTAEQKCYSEKGSCSGKETCTVDVKGYKGEQVTWKSSCGGYAYTTMDGQSEYAYFACPQGWFLSFYLFYSKLKENL